MHVGIRVDGGSDIGYGHLVRTRTLATELLARGHEVTFATNTPENARAFAPTEATVGSDPVSALDAASVDVVAMDLPSKSIDNDVELSTLETMRRYEEMTNRLIVFDDGDGGTVQCDVVVNGHVYATVDAYDWLESEPTWLLGSEYVVLDEEIRDASSETPPWRSPPEQVVVSMGGSDVAEVTPRAIRALDGYDFHVDVLVAPGFSDANREAIDEATEAVSTDVARHDDPDDLALILHDADFGVSALGLMTYEFLALGTPLVGMAVAPDQRPKAEWLDANDAGIVVDHESVASIKRGVDRMLEDAARRRRIRDVGRDYVDAHGVDRIVDEVVASR